MGVWNGSFFPAALGKNRRTGWDSVLILVHAAACASRQVSQYQGPIPFVPQTRATTTVLRTMWNIKCPLINRCFFEFCALMNFWVLCTDEYVWIQLCWICFLGYFKWINRQSHQQLLILWSPPFPTVPQTGPLTYIAAPGFQCFSPSLAEF